MSTPNILLPEVPQNTLQPSVPINKSMQIIDALIQLVPLDKDLTAPPTTVDADAGKTWIVAASATGAWSGKDNQVAICVGANLWEFRAPKAGWRAYLQDEDADYRFISGSWTLI